MTPAATPEALFVALLSKPSSPYVRRLDSDGSPVIVQLPNVKDIAARWAGPVLDASRELFREGQGFLSRPVDSDAEPKPVSLFDVARELVEVADTISERYTEHLRLLRKVAGPAAVEAYFVDVVRALRPLLPKYAAPKPERPKAPPKTVIERKASSRAALLERERVSAEWWLTTFWLVDEPGAVTPRAEMYEAAADVLADEIEEYEADAEDYECNETPVPGIPRVPRKSVFFAAAESLVGPPFVVRGVRCFRAVPIGRIAGLALDEARREVAEREAPAVAV